MPDDNLYGYTKRWQKELAHRGEFPVLATARRLAVAEALDGFHDREEAADYAMEQEGIFDRFGFWVSAQTLGDACNEPAWVQRSGLLDEFRDVVQLEDVLPEARERGERYIFRRLTGRWGTEAVERHRHQIAAVIERA